MFADGCKIVHAADGDFVWDVESHLGGGTATFVDPVAGSGTLEITNGTLRTTGGISSETKIAVASDGAFEWDSAATYASLSIAECGTLILSDLAAQTVADNVSLYGINLQVA